MKAEASGGNAELRALVLGSGGLTGLAWEVGVTDGLLHAGVNLRAANRIIGTSAGAVVATAIACGLSAELILRRLSGSVPSNTPLDVALLHAFAVSQIAPESPTAIRSLLRTAFAAAIMTEPEWLALITELLSNAQWSHGQSIVAMSGESGKARVFDSASGVPLMQAVAASCAIPGLFPPVRINGEYFIDGGLRTPANVDLAEGAAAIIVVAPRDRALMPDRRPSSQLQRHAGPRTLCISPGLPELLTMGANPLDLSRHAFIQHAGRARAEVVAEEARIVWNGPAHARLITPGR